MVIVMVIVMWEKHATQLKGINIIVHSPVHVCIGYQISRPGQKEEDARKIFVLVKSPRSS